MDTLEKTKYFYIHILSFHKHSKHFFCLKKNMHFLADMSPIKGRGGGVHPLPLKYIQPTLKRLI